MRKLDADAVASKRECGQCDACCVLPRISAEPAFPEGKRGYEPCPHLTRQFNSDVQTTGNCTCYDDRPDLCRSYTCLWRAGIIDGDERRRPDRLGLMFTLDTASDATSKVVFEAWELWPGAAADHPGRGVLDSIAQRLGVVVRFYGVPASVAYRGPQYLLLGQELSLWARTDPRRLATWCEANVLNGNLALSEAEWESVHRDLESLRRGQPVERPYRLK